MRNPNLGSVQFVPGDPGQSVSLEQLTRYVREMEQRMAMAFQALAAGHLDPVFVVPEKPRPGDIRYADGVKWNPGSGEGIYFYNQSGIWTQLG